MFFVAFVISLINDMTKKKDLLKDLWICMSVMMYVVMRSKSMRGSQARNKFSCN